MAQSTGKTTKAHAERSTTSSGKRDRTIDLTERAADVSQDVLKSVEAGQRAALAAVRKFVDTVDEALPAGERPTRRDAIVDAALDMADKLVTTQYDFLRSVVRSAERSVTKGGTSER